MYVKCALHSVTFESQQMGSLRRLNVETRSCFALALITQYENDNHFHSKRAEGERSLLIMIRNKAAWHGTAPQKKSEAKPSGTVFRTPMGG